MCRKGNLGNKSWLFFLRTWKTMRPLEIWKKRFSRLKGHKDWAENIKSTQRHLFLLLFVDFLRLFFLWNLEWDFAIIFWLWISRFLFLKIDVASNFYGLSNFLLLLIEWAWMLYLCFSILHVLNLLVIGMFQVRTKMHNWKSFKIERF